jgi:sugar lactone lactonase YvrE
VQDLLVSVPPLNQIHTVTPAGSITATFTSPLLQHPNGLAFDKSGNLFVANDAAHTITKTTPQGVAKTFASDIDHPIGLAFDGDGNLYASSATLARITKITPDGTKSTFGVFPPQVNAYGIGVAFDEAGMLYAAASSGEVYRFAPGGTRSLFVSGLNSPHGLAFDTDGDLYVGSYFGQRVYRVTPDGVATTFATGLGGAFGLAFDPGGDLFVANQTLNGSVARVAPDGTVTPFLTNLGSGPHFVAWQIPEPASGLVLLGALLVLPWRGRQMTSSPSRSGSAGNAAVGSA